MLRIKLFFIQFFLIILIPTNIFAGIKIHGVVSDEQFEPVIGATVVEKGHDTSNFTFTDLEGKFVIEVENVDQTSLIISCIGFKTKTVHLNGRTKINVILESDVSKLGDVVVIGYGTSKKNDLTGSISSIKSQAIEDDKSTSLTGILAGRIPGVLAISTSGAPGAATNIIIRGSSSVSGGTAPLYVIDGVIMDVSQSEVSASKRVGDEIIDPLSMINPDDIASMEILKDASATAIYGSRGANGVIIVTTKSGSLNKAPEVRVSYDFAFDDYPEMIKMLNGYEYENYMSLYYPFQIQNDGSLSPEHARYWNEDGTVKHSGKNTNWQKEVFRHAITHNFNASIIGGSQNASYALTTGFLDKTGIALGSSMDRFTYGSKVDLNVNKWLKVGLDLKGSQMKNNGIISAESHTSHNIFAQMLMFSPALNREDVVFEEDIGSEGTNYRSNPIVNIKNTVQRNMINRIQGLGYGEITFAKGLKLKSSYGGYINSVKTKNFYSVESGPGRNPNGIAQHATSKVTHWLNENILSFNKIFKKKHNVTALIGCTFEQTTTDKLKIETTNFILENLVEESLKNAQNAAPPSNDLFRTTMMSFLCRAMYSYNNKYFFNATIRADGSSIFPKGNKFSYFPSCAVSWKINEEKFMKNANWIDLLKLRFSYGQTGNARINNLSSLALLKTYYYSFNSKHGTDSPNMVLGLSPESIGNDILKWETTTQYNAGLDFMAFKGRLNLTVDAYYKNTRDLLITENIPSISGFTSAVRNIGKVSNKGMEFMLSSINIEKQNFTWITDLNISFNRNKVEEIGAGDRIPVSPKELVMDAYVDVFYIREGYPLGAMFGYVSDGLYQLQDFNEFYDEEGNFITDPARQKEIYNRNKFTVRDGVVVNGFTPPVPGGFKPKKIGNSDLPVNAEEDRVYLGSAEPLFFGGITNNFIYKNWSLNIQCTFSYGNKLFNANNRCIQGRFTSNISKKYYENFWLIDRQDGTMPHFKDIGQNMPSTIQVEDASYFKFKDITLSYKFSKKIIKKIGLQGFKLYVSARNFATITHYGWYDPEYIHPNPLMSGLDRYSYPTTTTFLFGARINF